MPTENLANIEEEIAAALLQAGDVYDAAEQVRASLVRHFGVEEVRIVLSDDLYFRDITPAGSRSYPPDHPIPRAVQAAADERGMVAAVQPHLPHVVHLHPLRYREALSGWLSFHHAERSTAVPSDAIENLRRLSPLLTLGLRHLYADARLRERLDELTALNRISQTMNSSLNVKETLESVMEAVVELSRADRALMYLLTEDEKFFLPTLGRGGDAGISLDFKVEVAQSVFRELLQTRQPLVVEDVAGDPRVNQELASRLKTRAFIAVPMISKERVIGIIGVDNATSGRPLTEINLDLLITLANQAAIALQNSRLFEKTERFNEQLRQEVARATAHLEKLLEMKSHFLTVASHQLRTPLSVIKGMLSMALEDPAMPPSEQQHLVTQAFRSSQRLERIINELLTATELEESAIRPHLTAVAPGELAREIAEELNPMAKKRGLELILNLPTEALPVLADRFKLYEALANLVDNAIRYTERGTVTFTVREQPNEIVFIVADSGIGLLPDEQDRIFEKFERGSGAMEKEPNGTGLGLFITKRLIETMAGRISVSSAGRNAGTTFTVALPKAVH
jgi:adenylate cyclase